MLWDLRKLKIEPIALLLTHRIITHDPMHKLDTVVTLSEAIYIVKNKFPHLIGRPAVRTLVSTYFTSPVPQHVWTSLGIDNPNQIGHNIQN